MENYWLEELAITFCAVMIIFMLICSILIPLLIYKINLAPNSYFLKNQTCRILKTYFSNELSDCFLVCAYHSKFFFLNGILTSLLGTIFLNWVFGIIYLPIFWNYSDDYSVFICNLCVIIFAILFNVLDLLISFFMWRLVKIWRKKYSNQILSLEPIDLLNNTNLSEISIYDSSGNENLKIKKYLLAPFYYLLTAVEKVMKNKNINNDLVKQKSYTIFYKTIFLLTRNIKWMEFISNQFTFFSFKLNESDKFFSIFEFLELINQILITFFTAINSENQKEFFNNYFSKILS